MSDVFISYASADRDLARLLADALGARGHSVWWDRTIPPGRVFDEVIQEAIHGARCMIVLWSADSVRSNWVKTEAAEGAARGILVPALVGEVALPIEFKRIQSANLSTWKGDETHSEFRNLMDAVERLTGQPPRPSDEPAVAIPIQDRQPQAALSHAGTKKVFGLAALVSILAIGAYGLYATAGKQLSDAAPAAGAPKHTAPPVSDAAPLSGNTTRSVPAPIAAASGRSSVRGRMNLLTPKEGGQLLVAAKADWKLLMDGKLDTYASTKTGFCIFGFRDGRPALIDTFSVFIPQESNDNIKEFELFVGNQSLTGPYESIGRFTTLNARTIQNPFQEFRFPPVKAKYVKFQSLNNHADSFFYGVQIYEVQLFGVLQ